MQQRDDMDNAVGLLDRRIAQTRQVLQVIGGDIFTDSERRNVQAILDRQIAQQRRLQQLLHNADEVRSVDAARQRLETLNRVLAHDAGHELLCVFKAQQEMLEEAARYENIEEREALQEALADA